MINRLCLRINPTISNVHMEAAGFKNRTNQNTRKNGDIGLNSRYQMKTGSEYQFILDTDKRVFIFISCRLNDDGERYQRTHKYRGTRVEYQENYKQYLARRSC